MASEIELPPFDRHGNLPQGDYWPSQESFEERFVHVDGSHSRPAIYEGFKRHRSEMCAAGVEGTSPCMLDGSFTTSKIEPGDIDLVVEVDAVTFLGTPRLHELLSGPEAKSDFSCDAYPLLVFPPDDPNYQEVTERGRAYWRKWFGTDRHGRPKGRVWAYAETFR